MGLRQLPAGHPQFDTKRSAMGELLYLLKYKADRSVIAEVADTAASFVRSVWPTAELLVPVPPSREQLVQPVLVVGVEVAKRLGIDFCPGCVRRTRDVPQLKDVFDYDERSSALYDHGQARDVYALALTRTRSKQ